MRNPAHVQPPRFRAKRGIVVEVPLQKPMGFRESGNQRATLEIKFGSQFGVPAFEGVQRGFTIAIVSHRDRSTLPASPLASGIGTAFLYWM